MSDFLTGAGTKFFIGTTAVHSNQTEYEADTYVQVKQAGDIGDFGDAFTDVSFTGLDDGRTTGQKGSADAGTVPIPFAFLETDPGQIALIAASEDTAAADYNFYVEWSNGAKRYFSGYCFITEGVGGPNDVLMLNANVRINTPITKVAAP